MASTDMAWTSGLPFARRTGSPVAGSMTMISGFRSLPRGAARQSETIFWLMPVASSISSRTEKPATRSTNFATPAFSAMIGRV